MEFWDDYSHPDSKVTYIFESMKTKEIELLSESELPGCDCVTDCIPNGCSCVARSGAFYSYTEKTQFKDYSLRTKDNNKPVYECNNNCSCNNVCGNRLVQFGPRKNLKIIDFNEGKGFSLIVEEPIEIGNFICEYAGEIITQVEAHRRYELYSKLGLKHNYVFCINENFGCQNEKTFIDPTFYGNVGRYINHSCEPNSILVPIRINDVIPKLYIFAKTSVDKNTEITFDYGHNSNSTTKCLCFSKNCRKFLPFDNTV